MIYDSEVDTRLHIDRVRFLLSKCAINLLGRGLKHDASKLESPEKTAFDLAGDRHLAVTYGSEEYRASLAELEPALAHHYANNSHHPQHYPNGINGMSLFDLLEMLMDWKATAERKLFPNLAHPARGDRAIREPQKGTNATNATPAGTRGVSERLVALHRALPAGHYQGLGLRFLLRDDRD